MKIVLEIQDKKQLDAVYIAYNEPVRIMNLLGDDYSELDTIPIDILDLNVRPANILKEYNIKNLKQLVNLTYFELLNFTNMGRKSVDEIVSALAKRGLFLKEKK